MDSKDGIEARGNALFDCNEVEGVLSGAFYAPPSSSERPARRRRTPKAKPTHYKVICISMYLDALGKLDGMVDELKARGYTKANRSALIRHALDVVDLDQVPRGL